MRSVCRDEGMPALRTVIGWLPKYPEFELQYVHACEARTLAWAEEIVEIADGIEDDDPVAIQRDRLRIDTRKWLMAKCMPKKYGTKPDEHGGNVTVILRNFDSPDEAGGELPSGAPRLIDIKPFQ